MIPRKSGSSAKNNLNEASFRVHIDLRTADGIPIHTRSIDEAERVGLGVAAEARIPGLRQGRLHAGASYSATPLCLALPIHVASKVGRDDRSGDLEPRQHRPAECWPATCPGNRALSVADPVIDCAAPQGCQTAVHTAALALFVIFTGRFRWSTETHHVAGDAVLTASTTASGRSTVVRDPDVGAISVSLLGAADSRRVQDRTRRSEREPDACPRACPEGIPAPCRWRPSPRRPPTLYLPATAGRDHIAKDVVDIVRDALWFAVLRTDPEPRGCRESRAARWRRRHTSPA